MGTAMTDDRKLDPVEARRGKNGFKMRYPTRGSNYPIHASFEGAPFLDA